MSLLDNTITIASAIIARRVEVDVDGDFASVPNYACGRPDDESVDLARAVLELFESPSLSLLEDLRYRRHMLDRDCDPRKIPPRVHPLTAYPSTAALGRLDGVCSTCADYHDTRSEWKGSRT